MALHPLKWDSTFFNLKIGKISDIESLPSAQEIKEYDLIYIEQLNDKKIKKKAAALFNIDYTDKKINFLKILKKDTQEPDKNIKEYNSKTANKKLIDLAIQSGVFSRFKLDSHFSDEGYKKLYIQWIKNSVKKKSADLVLVYGDARKPEGFITLLFKEQLAQIGLIAVDSEHQKKGIGKALISAVEYYAKKNNCTKLQVVTQAENKNACHFYEKRGFKNESVIYTHHHWKI